MSSDLSSFIYWLQPHIVFASRNLAQLNLRQVFKQRGDLSILVLLTLTEGE